MGPAACEHFKRLRIVDISQTEISEILGGTFAHCSQLQQLRLAEAVRRIGRDALLNCTSLGELHIPPALLFIDKRAFAGCTQLRTLIRVGSKTTWRGTYAVHDAFESCVQLVHHAGMGQELYRMGQQSLRKTVPKTGLVLWAADGCTLH